MIFSVAAMAQIVRSAGLHVTSVRTVPCGARGVHVLSERLRAGQHLQLSGPMPAVRQVAGVPFQLKERSLIAAGRHAGEEIIMTATRV
jgi:hypothetical protein